MKATSFTCMLLTLAVGATAMPKVQTKTPGCANVDELVKGINANIEVQNQEILDVAAIKAVLEQKPFDKTKFKTAKSKLLSTMKKGVDIRTKNQKLAGKDNNVAAGLKIVEDAQAKELTQAKSLQGTNDVKTLEKLKTEFEGGISQNKQNAETAAKGCGGTGKATPTGPDTSKPTTRAGSPSGPAKPDATKNPSTKGNKSPSKPSS